MLVPAAFFLQAQQLSLFTQYREHTSIINPAAIEGDFLAFGRNINFGASYRSQWTGLSGNPTTQTLRGTYLAADMSGVAIMAGGHLINDQTGPTGFTGMYARFGGVLTNDPAYGGLAIGLTAGFVQYRVNTSEITLRDEGDVVGTVDQAQMHPDVGVGIYYYQTVGEEDYFYTGLSIPQVIGLDLTFQDENGEFFTQRVQHFYGLLGFYKFFNNDSFLEPSMWIKYAPEAPVNVDVNVRYQMPAALWVGAGASSSRAVHLEAGLVLGNNVGLDNLIKIGYGFDYNFSDFGPTAGTTHEINLGFSFDN